MKYIVAVFALLFAGTIVYGTATDDFNDEIATSVCASLPSAGGSGYRFAVRRKCNEQATCQDICRSSTVATQLAWKWTQHMTFDCIESLHIYKNRPSLQPKGDEHKIGLLTKRYLSCSYRNPNGCGPNYCCCKKAH